MARYRSLETDDAGLVDKANAAEEKIKAFLRNSKQPDTVTITKAQLRKLVEAAIHVGREYDVSYLRGSIPDCELEALRRLSE